MANSTAGNIILSVRDQIPDPVVNNDYTKDGSDFSLATILRWLNDAQRTMCARANIIQDWFALPSLIGMDVYPLPDYITTVDEMWYNLIPLEKSPEINDIYIAKLQGRAWWFGPHSVHAVSRIHVWPACDTAGALTNLTVGCTATDTTLFINPTLLSGGPVNQMGFLNIDNEQIIYRNYDAVRGIVSNVLRGQSGTAAVSHSLGAPVQEANIMMKCFRQPITLVTADDLIEIPKGLWPLLELYVLSKVRDAEQDRQSAKSLMDDFNKAVDTIAGKRQTKGMVQGMQVRSEGVGPSLFMGHIFIR